MLKKLATLAMACSLVLLTGCGVNIRQEGNKIFTNASKEDAYSFAEAALKTKGYKVKESSKVNLYIIANPEFNETFKVENAENTEVKAVVSDNPKNNAETMVTVLALASGGSINEEKSKEIADKAVAEIIAELDKYGKHIAEKKLDHVYPIATLDQVTAYVRGYAETKKLAAEVAADGTITLKESTSNNPFNEPLVATIKIVADETNKTTVAIDAQIQGNYDAQGNQAAVDAFVAALVEYLDQYPVAEKGARFAYKYISFEKAFSNTKLALSDFGATVGAANATDYTVTAQKKGTSYALSLTELNTNLAINISAFKEGSAQEAKATLTEAITTDLNKLQNALAAYQTIYSTEKVFIGTNTSDMNTLVKKVVTKLGFKIEERDGALLAINKTNAYIAHYITIQANGGEGNTLRVETMYNTKAATAFSIAKTENAKLMKALSTAAGSSDLK